MSCGGAAVHNANRAVLAEVTRASGVSSRECAVVFHGLIAAAKSGGVADQQVAEAWARQQLARVVAEGAALAGMRHDWDEVTGGFDAVQREWLTGHGMGLVERRLVREGVDPGAAVDRDVWVGLCAERVEACRVVGDEAGVRAWLVAAGGVPPVEGVARFAVRARRQGVGAARAYAREARLLAGFHGVDHDQVAGIIEGLRREWPGESGAGDSGTGAAGAGGSGSGAVPGWFTTGIDGSYWGADAIKRPPMDPATVWAWHQVLTRPELTAGCDARDGYVVFDTETTGVHYGAHIVQLTAIRYDRDGGETGRIATYVRPGGDLGEVFGSEQAQAATAITGITADTVADAPSFAEIAPRVRELMGGQVLVGHNVLFDYPRVQRALAYAGQQSGAGRDAFVLPASPLVDTLRLARWAQPNPGVPVREWRHTLAEACGRAGVPFDPAEAHDATYDVRATHGLFRWLRGVRFGGQ